MNGYSVVKEHPDSPSENGKRAKGFPWPFTRFLTYGAKVKPHPEKILNYFSERQNCLINGVFDGNLAAPLQLRNLLVCQIPEVV